MSDLIESYDDGDFTAEIYHDEDTECPREHMLTHVIMPSRNRNRRYIIDDRPHGLQHSHDELVYRGMGMQFGRYVSIFHPKYVALPCYMYDHGNVQLSVQSFEGRAPHATWDSRMIGWAIIERLDWLPDPERIMSSELEELSMWMNGETYRYVINDIDGDEVDSCGGFIGIEYAEQEAKVVLKHYASQAPKQLEFDLTRDWN